MENNDIVVLESPIEVDTGEWIENHIECDTVVENISQGIRMLVYAYADSPEGNISLKKFRDEKMKGKKILKGLSRYAFTSFI